MTMDTKNGRLPRVIQAEHQNPRLLVAKQRRKQPGHKYAHRDLSSPFLCPLPFPFPSLLAPLAPPLPPSFLFPQSAVPQTKPKMCEMVPKVILHLP